MRRMIREVIEGARDGLMQFRRERVGDRTMSEEEMLRRYVRKHQGNVQELIEFARRRAPPDANPLTEAVRYEQEMERLIRARGG